MWERWKCGRVVWGVPRFQGRDQGVASSLQGRPCPRGNGATFRPFFALQPRNLSCADKSGVELLSRSGAMEAIQTSKLVIVGRRDQNSACLDDGFGLDGTWHDHGFYHCMPRDQSSKTGGYYRPKLNVHTDLNPLYSWRMSLVD